VIALEAPALPPAEAARRAGTAPGAFWLSAPGDDEITIARDMIGVQPVRVVRGDSVVDLERAWQEERIRWNGGRGGDGGGPAIQGIPIAAGWLSYDLGRPWMGLPPVGADAAFAPLEFHFYDAVWVCPVGGPATIFAHDDAAARRLRTRLDEPAAGRPASPLGAASPLGTLAPEHDDHVYLDGVRRVLEYLRAGDAYQVNLARRLSVPFGGDALALAAALRVRAPAPFAAFIASSVSASASPSDEGGGFLVGNSPERFLALDGRGGVETRPIKGTRSREGTAAADREARDALAASAKDRAEHVMIVDLERNDLGRVCETGTVRVEGVGRIIDLPTVFHMVSTVRGMLRPEVGLAALLTATFPGGSITGAPKKRAMQIIDELEPVPRGPYTGATGWLGAAGDLDLAVAIRTALVRTGPAGRLSLSVGGGIVADSTPEGEWAETEVKARAFARLCGA
jgi:para-aminobenzoate synthetase component I